ncbi:MAG: hypothetical protein ACHQF0_14905 [Chitinophagales bacterium]
MKKNLTITTGIILIMLVLFTRCKKNAAPVSGENNSESAGIDNFFNNGCRLVHHEWQGAFIWDFQYNNKGLAYKWTIDIGDGFPQTYTMKYDRFNRLIKDYDTVENTAVYIDSYIYSGNRITEDKWTSGDGSSNGDIVFTYNNRGQIAKTDDNINDIHSVLSYDRFGNCTQENLYYGSDLYFSDNYTFNVPIENPWRTIHGIDFAFPYTGVGL